jgi:alpha-aminoadipic semialdehyde synthase
MTGGTGLLSDYIRKSDIVISLLPYSLHPQIAEECIKSKVNMVTASYCSPQMMELGEAAKEAGVTIVNEVGLDPGIDHLLAMEAFDEIRSHGGKVESFVSYCGGLPAPEASDNPLRYKFSWSPRGVLLNALNGAKYVKGNEVVEINGGGELMSLENVHKVNFLPGFSFEGFANRDSLTYKKLYGIQEAHTVLRGTLRYTGFAETMRGLIKLGLIDPNPHPALHPKGPEITWVGN